MKENLHSRDTERASPQLCVARRKHLYALPPLSLRQLENPVAWKNPSPIVPLRLTSSNTFGMVEGTESRTKTCYYFISSVRKYYRRDPA